MDNPKAQFEQLRNHPSEPQRTRGPQGERGPSGGNAVLDVLSYPQRKLKEAISGSEDSWGLTQEIPRASVLGIAPGNVEGNFEPEPISVSAQETALDFTVDPLDLVTAGAFKAGSVAAKAAGIARNAHKGRLSSGFSNYVNNYYGLPADVAEMTPEQAKKALALADQYEKMTGNKVPPESRQALLAKFEGVMETLSEGIKVGAKNFFNPIDSARWKQYGVNKANQNLITGHLKNLEKAQLSGEKGGRWEAKALSQGHYLNHILRQSGREGNIHPAVQKLAEMSNLESYVPNNGSALTDMMVKHSPAEVSEADLGQINRHFQEVNGNPDLIVMKRPEQAASGKHRFDLYSGRNAGYRNIEGAFKDILSKGQEVTHESIGAALEARQQKYGGFRFVEADDGSGWYVHNGTNASAITEGGINSLIKIQPDGQMMAIMSDRHDWLENAMKKVSKVVNKIPGVNLDVENAILEKSLAAVSPPIFRNIYESNSVNAARRKALKGDPAVAQYETDLKAWKAEKKKVQEENKAQGTRKRLPPEPENPVPPMMFDRIKDTGNVLPSAQSSPEVIQALRDVTQINPTGMAVGSELLNRAGMLSGAGSVSNRFDSEQTSGGLPMHLLNPEEQERRRLMLSQVGEVSPQDSSKLYQT